MFFELLRACIKRLYLLFSSDFRKQKIDDDEEKTMYNDSYYINVRDSYEHVLASD